MVLIAAGESSPPGVCESTECSLNVSSISKSDKSFSFETSMFVVEAEAAEASVFQLSSASQNRHPLGTSTGPNCHDLASVHSNNNDLSIKRMRALSGSFSQ